MATTIPTHMTMVGELIRHTVAASASEAERAAVQGFLSALRLRSTPPTPNQIDTDYSDVRPEIRDLIKWLIENVPWGIVVAIVSLVFSTLYARHLSDNTDAKIAELHKTVDNFQAQAQDHHESTIADRDAIIEYLEAEARKQLEPPTNHGAAPGASGRANPKGTQPRRSEKKRKRRRR